MNNLLLILLRSPTAKACICAGLLSYAAFVYLTKDSIASTMALLVGGGVVIGTLLLEWIVMYLILFEGVRYAPAKKEDGALWNNRIAPTRGKPGNRDNSGSAGLDLYYAGDRDMEIIPGQRVVLPTGWIFQIPYGWVGLIHDRSSVAVNDGLMVLGGVIDSDYRGHVSVIMCNISEKTVKVEMKKKIAQMVCVPYLYQDPRPLQYHYMSQTERGTGGFGSSNVKNE